MANTSKPSGSTRDTPEQMGSQAAQFASDVKHKTQETASGLTERAKEAASTAVDRTKEMASNLGSKAQEAAASVGQRAQEMASNLGSRAEETRSSVGDQMKSLAGTIREKAPHEGVTGRAASAVASGLETGGTYLQEHSFRDMAGDMNDLIRRYPLQSLLVGIGIGFLLARATRR